jgi:hypothetical protein
MSESRPDVSFIVRDNETATARALEDRNFIHAYLLVHALVESLLRVFLKNHDENTTFHGLIEGYKQFLSEQEYPEPTFAKELTEFNRHRNRIIHQLWRKGFSFANTQAEPAARAAVIMYGLFVEWLETFDPEITTLGFEYDAA